MANNIIIAVIDDGINEKVYGLKNIRKNLEISKELKVVSRKNYNIFESSHGTICGGIINEYGNNSIIHSIKVLSEKSGKSNKYALITAINWCIDNEVKIINLSLGTIDFRDFKEIQKVVNLAVSKGIIIVAANNNTERLTYPASLSNVIGVKCDRKLFGDEYKTIQYPFDGIDIIASGKHRLETNEIEYTIPCNSYATPMITAKVYNILKENNSLTLEELKIQLHRQSKQSSNQNEILYNPYIQFGIDWVKEALLINFGSKREGLKLEYSINIVSEINIGVEDFKRVNSQNESLLKVIMDKLGNKKIAVNDYYAIVLNRDDSTILDYKKLMEVFIYFNETHKNIIYLDNDLLPERVAKFLMSNKAKVWSSDIYQKLIDNELIKQKEIDIPIVVFYGYKSEDIVFILSSFINLFKKSGYYSIGATSDCKSILYGLQYTGKNINTENLLRKLYEKYYCDIILLGISEEYILKSKNKESLEYKEIDILISEESLVDTLKYLIGEKTINFTINENNTLNEERVLNLFDCILKQFKD